MGNKGNNLVHKKTNTEVQTKYNQAKYHIK